jgi:hypothetical protein
MQSRRSPRTKTQAPAACQNGRGITWDVQVDDISLGGCRVDDPRHSLELGAHIQLMIAETGPYTVEVAWRQGDRVGLEFLTKLDPVVFDLMASGDWERAHDSASGGTQSMPSTRYPVRRIM